MRRRTFGVEHAYLHIREIRSDDADRDRAVAILVVSAVAHHRHALVVVARKHAAHRAGGEKAPAREKQFVLLEVARPGCWIALSVLQNSVRESLMELASQIRCRHELHAERVPNVEPLAEPRKIAFVRKTRERVMAHDARVNEVPDAVLAKQAEECFRRHAAAYAADDPPARRFLAGFFHVNPSSFRVSGRSQRPEFARCKFVVQNTCFF